MSGGSWDYVYNRFDEVAEKLLGQPQVERKALGRLVRLIGKAMHDIEWVDSSDYCDGDELKAINLALGKNAKELKMDILIQQGKEIIEKIQELSK